MDEDILKENPEASDIFELNPNAIWEVLYTSQGQAVSVIVKVLQRKENSMVFYGFLKSSLHEIREFDVTDGNILEVKPMEVDESIAKTLRKTFINYRKCKTMHRDMDELRKGIKDKLTEMGDTRDSSIVQELKRQSAKVEIFRKAIRFLELENQLLSNLFIVV